MTEEAITKRSSEASSRNACHAVSPAPHLPSWHIEVPAAHCAMDTAHTPPHGGSLANRTQCPVSGPCAARCLILGCLLVGLRSRAVAHPLCATRLEWFYIRTVDIYGDRLLDEVDTDH